MVDESLGEMNEVIAASVETTRLARTLHGGQDQARERADDRDDHEHLDEGEGAFVKHVNIAALTKQQIRVYPALFRLAGSSTVAQKLVVHL